MDRAGPRCRQRSAASPDRRLHLVATEDREHTDELVRVRKERERRHGDVAFGAVDARYSIALVSRAAFVESDSGRSAVEGQRLRLERARVEPRRPLVEGHLAHFRERLLDDLLRCLVEEDKATCLVGDERRRGEIRCELAREDQYQMLVARHRHWDTRTPRLPDGLHRMTLRTPTPRLTVSTTEREMDGQDPADLLEALLRRLRRLRPPVASVVFRRRAWRDFERSLDPLGLPRDRTEIRPGGDVGQSGSSRG